MRTPLAVENSVGKLAAPEMRRLMSAREREHGELPSPNLSLFSRKVGQAHFVSFVLSVIQSSGAEVVECWRENQQVN